MHIDIRFCIYTSGEIYKTTRKNDEKRHRLPFFFNYENQTCKRLG